MASEIGWELEEVVFDSSAFQFWGTALYELGQPLNPALVKTLLVAKNLRR